MRIGYLWQQMGAEPGIALHAYTAAMLAALRTHHQVTLLGANGRRVLSAENAEAGQEAPLGLTGTFPFRFAESGIRKTQSGLGLPYLGFADSVRFHEACARRLRGYDILHERMGLMCYGGALAARRMRLPLVLAPEADLFVEMEMHGTPLRGVQSELARRAAKYCLSSASIVLCLSDALARHFEKTWQVDPAKIRVLPLAADVAAFGGPFDTAAVRARWGLGDRPVAVFVGGFQPWHGLELLVSSFAQVLRVKPQAMLLLVGEGERKPDIERMVTEKGLAGSVVFTGRVPPAQVPELVAAADIALVPYPRTAMELWFSPLKLYEYMAAGKPIVACRASQVAQVLQDGENALLVDPGDEQGMAGAVVKLLGDEALRARLGAQAQAQARACHSWERYAIQLDRIYQELIP